MIRAFLRHHLQRAALGEIKNAVVNCHAVGVHSIVLHDDPGNRIRMFIANYDHEITEGAIAVHSHHCDVRLVRVFGQLKNYSYPNPILHATGSKLVHPTMHRMCRWASGIGGGQPSLVPCDFFAEFETHIASAVQTETYLAARQLHTVSVPRGSQAAWLVIEGEEDPSYEPLCYSRSPEKFDPAPLYKPMRCGDIYTYLMLCLLRINEEEASEPR